MAEYTCIVCPNHAGLPLRMANGLVITGNGCKRGWNSPGTSTLRRAYADLDRQADRCKTFQLPVISQRDPKVKAV